QGAETYLVDGTDIEKIELESIRINGEPFQLYICRNKYGDIVVEISPFAPIVIERL
ncbi:unnamed protein product, partial [marine sediment metagenome]